MSVEADRRIIDRLLAPQPKIILAAADAATAQGLAHDSLGDHIGLDWIEFRPATASSRARLQLLEDPPSMWELLPAPPGGPCILAAFTTRGCEVLGELVSWWSEECPDTAPHILDLRACTAGGTADSANCRAALYGHLLGVTSRDLRIADKRIADLNGELYELRTEYEQARGVLQRLQNYLVNLQSPCRLIDQLQPSNAVYPRKASRPGRVRQLLPMSAEGLAAIDLYSPPQPHGKLGIGHLLIVLQGSETPAPLGTWRVPYERLGRGWFRCSLPAASMLPVHRLELIVVWLTDQGDPPSLALSSVGAFPEIWASADGSPLGGGLAYTVWGMLPGARVPPAKPGDSSFLVDSPSPLAIEYSLEPQDFKRIKRTATATFQYMHPLGEVVGFRLHPLEHTLATAVLSRGCIGGTDRLRATVQIRNESAQHPVEYALCLTDASERCSVFPAAPENDRRVVGFSGWQTVPADNQPHVVAMELDKPLSATADLHFATRMKDRQPINGQWADWLDVRIRVRYGASTGCELPIKKSGRPEPPPTSDCSKARTGADAAKALQPVD